VFFYCVNICVKGKVSYESAGILIGPSPAFAPHTGEENYCMMDQINRVQDASFNFSIERQDIKQINSFTMADRKIVSQPEVNLSFSYLLTNSFNERKFGFHISDEENYSAIKNFYDKTTEDRNLFFLITNREGRHLEFATNVYEEAYRDETFTASIGAATQNKEIDADVKMYDFKDYDIIGFGNSFLTNYSVSAAIGSYPSASVDWSCCNMKFDKQDESENITRGISSSQTFTGCLSNIVKQGGQEMAGPESLGQEVIIYNNAVNDGSQTYFFDKEDNALVLIHPDCVRKRGKCNNLIDPEKFSFEYDVSLPVSLNRDQFDRSEKERHFRVEVDLDIGVFDEEGAFIQDADFTLSDVEVFLVKENESGKIKKLIHEYGQGYGYKKFRVRNVENQIKIFWDDHDAGHLDLSAFMDSDVKATWSLHISSFAGGRLNEFNVSAVVPIYHDIPAINRQTGDIANRPKYNIIANDFIYPEHINALLPGDVVLELENPNVGGTKLLNDDNSVNIQSFQMEIPLARENLFKLGSRYVCDRKLLFPQLPTISITLIVDKLLQGELHQIFNRDKKYNFNIKLKKNFEKANAKPGSPHYIENEKIYESDYSKPLVEGNCDNSNKAGDWVGTEVTKGRYYKNLRHEDGWIYYSEDDSQRRISVNYMGTIFKIMDPEDQVAPFLLVTKQDIPANYRMRILKSGEYAQAISKQDGIYKRKSGKYIGSIKDEAADKNACEDREVDYGKDRYEDQRYFGNENEESIREDFIIYKIRGAKLVSQDYALGLSDMMECSLSFDFEISPEFGFHIQGAGEPISQEHNFLIFQEDSPFMITMEDSDLPISLRG